MTRPASSWSTCRSPSQRRTSSRCGRRSDGSSREDASVGLVVFGRALRAAPARNPRLGDAPAAAPARASKLGPPVHPWSQTFESGPEFRRARSHEGDARARRGRQRGHPPRQRLETAADDVPHLARTVAEIRRSPIALRVYPLGPSSDARRIFGGLLDEKARRPSRPGMPSPWRASRVPARRALLILGGLLFAVLALHERFGVGWRYRGSGGQGDSPPPHETCRPGRRGTRVLRGLGGAAPARGRRRSLAGRTSTGDVHYQVAPQSDETWQPDAFVAFNAARALLGVQDDVELRRAVRAFANARSRSPPSPIPRSRCFATVEAQARLEAIAGGDGDRVRRRAPRAPRRSRPRPAHVGDTGSGDPSRDRTHPISSSRSPSIPGTATRSSTSNAPSAGADRPRGGGRRSEAVARRGAGARGAGAGEPGSGY